MTMGDRLKSLRLARGWSQRDLSDMSMVSIGTISNIERDRIWGRDDTHLMLANAFGIYSLQEFREGVDTVLAASEEKGE